MNSFYCLVRIILNKKIALYCFHCKVPQITDYNISNISCPICFTAKSFSKMIQLLSVHSCFNSITLSHMSYLAIELYKAELSLSLNQVYIQN